PGPALFSQVRRIYAVRRQSASKIADARLHRMLRLDRTGRPRAHDGTGNRRGTGGAMAARRWHRRLKKRTRRRLQGVAALMAAAAVVWAVRNWSVVWPVLVSVLAAAVLGGAGWKLLQAH